MQPKLAWLPNKLVISPLDVMSSRLGVTNSAVSPLRMSMVWPPELTPLYMLSTSDDTSVMNPALALRLNPKLTAASVCVSARETRPTTFVTFLNIFYLSYVLSDTSLINIWEIGHKICQKINSHLFQSIKKN
jgi:hypothetical protein